MHAFCMTPYRLGISTSHFPVVDMEWPLCCWGYGPAHFQLRIRTGPCIYFHWTLTTRQQSYNDVHGWYRARIEDLFGQLWRIWHGGPDELHQSVRVLLHFTQFCIRRQVRHPCCGPWDHVLPHVWTDKSNPAATQDEGEDEADVCALCC